MTPGYPRLLGDIGGTNARWAWRAAPGSPIQDVVSRPCAGHASLYDAAADYLVRSGHTRPAEIAIGVATAVTGDQVHLTNHSWHFSIAELKARLGAGRCLVINDFTALALSIPALAASDLRAIGGGRAVQGSPLALLGPGTGLGVSGLVRARNGGWSALAGEGGHATLAAFDEREAALIAALRRRFGHVSAERVLSGQGLVNLQHALCELQGQPVRPLTPAEVTQHALAASDALCAQAVQLFTGFLGNVAGNVALTLGARGGVYLGGGIVPRLGRAFDEALFRQRFEAKGRFSGYLEGVPVWLITAAQPALLGADRALDEAG